MADSSQLPSSPARSIRVGPLSEEWRAMSPDARESFLLDVIDALSDVQTSIEASLLGWPLRYAARGADSRRFLLSFLRLRDGV